jgi:hypothetical protein
VPITENSRHMLVTQPLFLVIITRNKYTVCVKCSVLLMLKSVVYAAKHCFIEIPHIQYSCANDIDNENATFIISTLLLTPQLVDS